jgi:hypothetical protein
MGTEFGYLAASGSRFAGQVRADSFFIASSDTYLNFADGDKLQSCPKFSN